MLEQARLGKDELLAEYADDGALTKLLRLVQLTEFLSGCILKPEYHIPDQLNNAIRLSPYGEKVNRELITKHDVPAKEARVMCLLVAVYTEPLIDIFQTDIDALAETISDQAKDGSLLYPFIFGRELYDRAAELFDDKRQYLNYQDTLRLLEGTSPGVFHFGPYLLGPYGMLRTDHVRTLIPGKRIQLFHCSELTCHAVHSCSLSTNDNASINENMAKIHKVLDKEAPQPWAWGEVFREVSGAAADAYNDLSYDTLPYLIGDALSDTELRHLTVHLFNSTSGALRESVKPLGLRGEASECVANLTRAELMQVLLLCEDATIVEALDSLVLDGAIDVPQGEIRKPVVNRAVAAGRFAVQVQVGSSGCRAHSLRQDLGPLRLRRLVDELYLLNDKSDVSELDWQIREVEAPNPSSKLDEYLRSFTPEEVVRRLVLARRTNMIAACASLGIDEHRHWTDDELVAAILWKLDFVPSPRPDEHARFWELHEKMKQVTQTAGVSALVDREDIRGRASNYFVALEQLLDDCLAYSIWAMTNDHISSPRPFAFRAAEDTDSAFERLDQYEVERESGSEVIRYTGNRTLFTLARGFGSLASMLENLEQDESAHLRAQSDFPQYSDFTNLKGFPFLHTIPFLDLLPESRETVLCTLRGVSRSLLDAKVSDVRNDQMHYRRSTADLDRLSTCLSAVESSARALEEVGLTRLLFRPLRDQADEWGRELITLVDSRGREIAIARPSFFDWLGLPGLRRPQYLATSCVFHEPMEFLRFREDLSSDYSEYWEGYPKRRSHSRSSTNSSVLDQTRETSVVSEV